MAVARTPLHTLRLVVGAARLAVVLSLVVGGLLVYAGVRRRVQRPAGVPRPLARAGLRPQPRPHVPAQRLIPPRARRSWHPCSASAARPGPLASAPAASHLAAARASAADVETGRHEIPGW